ncbi:MAG: hypothetical protein EO766_11855 [Hydrotalea sp. AMD]|uniref:hypothetical protein n=1 Tax=Hydrotalea sp. AMD TaxID=2501297 RepID=UPI0010273E91|nr:hypothetical protein [Hydrotalea sp. AMD]RWZ87216.1 MAG: hypothetical protein EO766_11855 [Hydrotalea sp. AMD]
MCEVYRLFAKDWEQCCDFSEEMMVELFYSESYGEEVSPNNGFYVGKRYLNLNVAMWKEDIQKGLLFKHELYEDHYPHWWLDKILRN